MHAEFANQMITPENKETYNIFEIDPEIEKFGGVQKFVLLKQGGDYILGSFANLNHSEILTKMKAAAEDEVLGGGLFKVDNNTITIDTSFMTSKLGPINIPYADLKTILQNVVGDRYKVELSE